MEHNFIVTEHFLNLARGISVREGTRMTLRCVGFDPRMRGIFTARIGGVEIRISPSQAGKLLTGKGVKYSDSQDSDYLNS